MPDPFSEVLSQLGSRSARGTRLEASGEWALSFDGRGRLKFVALMRGRCWLILPDCAPTAMQEGDVFLLSNTRYAVASDPGVDPIDGMALYSLPGQDIVRLGEGCETVMVGGGSAFAEGCAAFVLDALPPFIRIDRATPSAEGIARTLDALLAEVRHGGVGSTVIAERLADILVVEAVRAHVAVGPTDDASWITALADPRIGKAITLMHGDVSRRWTVPLLAQEVGMSRSAFMQRFSERVGRPPMDYLMRWRMTVAQQKLAAGEAVARVAAEVGYGSQSAFAHAFKRVVGQTPRFAR